jgi:tRNA1Val (adenine37-N6)-methyltransferase
MTKLVKNSLGYDSDLFVYQDKSMFNYSVDTILLGNFISINNRVRNILEIGTNNAALSIFISERNSKLKIDALEIQDKAVEIAHKNIELNKKQSQIKIIHDDFNDYYKKCVTDKVKYDSVVCNPPFYKVDASIRRDGSNELYIATHEVKLNLEQIIKGASKIVKQKGYLALVHTTERLVDILELMRKYHFEPKRIQMIHPREDVKSNLVLVEGRYRTG